MGVANETKNLTILGADSAFDGEINFSSELVVLGKFSGKINSTGDVLIQKSAVCNVDEISASSIFVSGVVNGNMTAEKSVEMKSGSKIKGDVQASQIRIEDGVEFDGNVTMCEDKDEVDIFSYSGAELKSLFSKKDAET